MIRVLYPEHIKTNNSIKKRAKNLNRTSTKICKWPISAQKRCSTSLVTGEMHIKTTTRFQFIPTLMAIIKKWKIASVGEDVEKWIPSTHLVEYKTLQLLWKTVYDSPISLLDIYPQNRKQVLAYGYSQQHYL